MCRVSLLLFSGGASTCQRLSLVSSGCLRDFRILHAHRTRVMHRHSPLSEDVILAWLGCLDFGRCFLAEQSLCRVGGGEEEGGNSFAL